MLKKTCSKPVPGFDGFGHNPKSGYLGIWGISGSGDMLGPETICSTVSTTDDLGTKIVVMV